MRREVDMKDISDGKLYGLSDMVKADCGGCEGCSACCTNMGQSILLDPLDIYHLTTNLNVTFEELLGTSVELNMFDGVILPNIRMSGDSKACAFLSEEGRCMVHPFRPGICRLFPLGRYYEAGGFRYFLQIHECRKENRSKVKVRKWIDIPDIRENEKYIMAWHDFVKEVQEKLIGKEEAVIKKTDLFILQHFFLEKYSHDEPFYTQFYARLKKAKELI